MSGIGGIERLEPDLRKLAFYAAITALGVCSYAVWLIWW